MFAPNLKSLVGSTLVSLCLSGGSASAQTLEQVARLEIIPGWQTQSGTHMAGLRVTLRPGWKTYWRAPGDAGIPPQFSWAGSENIAAARLHWPTPEVLDQNDTQTIGYRDSLVLPIELSPNQLGAPITLAGEVLLGVCEDICMPVTLSFAATLPVGGERDSAITAALLNQPMSADAAGVTAVTCRVSPSAKGLEVTATVIMPDAGGDEAVVIETPNPEIWVSPSDVQRQGNQLQATVDMVHVTSSSFALDRSDLTITVLGTDHAVNIQGCTQN